MAVRRDKNQFHVQDGRLKGSEECWQVPLETGWGWRMQKEDERKEPGGSWYPLLTSSWVSAPPPPGIRLEVYSLKREREVSMQIVLKTGRLNDFIHIGCKGPPCPKPSSSFQLPDLQPLPLAFWSWPSRQETARPFHEEVCSDRTKGLNIGHWGSPQCNPPGAHQRSSGQGALPPVHGGHVLVPNS